MTVADRCDGCGRFSKSLTRQPYTQADYLFGGDPIWLCAKCDPKEEQGND